MLLNESDSVLFDMLSNSSSRTFFFFSDLSRNRARWSKGAVDYFGLEGEIIDPALETWIKRIHPDDIDQYLADFQVMVESKEGVHDCEYRIMNAEGIYVWVNCKGIVQYDEEGRPIRFAGFVTNMGVRNKFDPVTDLLTVFELRNDIDAKLQRHNKGAILQFSVIDFKKINDLYSYSFGDNVLKEIAHQFVKIVGNDSVYRLEGTDFAVVIPDATKEMVEDVHRKLTGAVRHLFLDGKIIDIKFHCCCVFYPDHGEFVDPLQSRLSYTLDRAKTEKTEEIIYFSDEIHEEQLRAKKLKDELIKSVDNNCEGFRMVYQPIFDATGDKLIAAEALLRWDNSEFPKIGPMQFVPILEDTGLIKDVGKWIINTCVSKIADWKREGKKQIKIHINMSLIQLMDESIIAYVDRVLQAYDVDPGLLVLELTESCRVEYSEELGKELQRFRDLGVEIALDDFGTGYASLSVLKDIPANIVKLDHTMIRSILDRPKDKSLIEFIIMYCNKIDISVCAEGVENKQILDLVNESGADMLQGYHFDKPLETEEFEKKYL